MNATRKRPMAIAYVTRGTGLGLAVARSLIEAHRGTIGLTSQPGRGARVLDPPPAKEVAVKAEVTDAPPAPFFNRLGAVGDVWEEVPEAQTHPGLAKVPELSNDRNRLAPAS